MVEIFDFEYHRGYYTITFRRLQVRKLFSFISTIKGVFSWKAGLSVSPQKVPLPYAPEALIKTIFLRFSALPGGSFR